DVPRAPAFARSRPSEYLCSHSTHTRKGDFAMTARSIDAVPRIGRVMPMPGPGKSPRIGRPRRIGTTALGPALLLAAALAPPPAHAQTTASDSSATNRVAEIFSTSSGWNTEEKLYINAPPVGAWSEQYKHWFTPGGAPP